MSTEVRPEMNGSPTRLAGQAPHGRHFPYLTGLRAQRTIELTALRLAPAATAGAITYAHLESEWQGLLVFASMFAVGTLLRSSRYPVHLIHFASAVLYLLAAPLGACLAVLISTLDGSPTQIAISDMAAPVLGAWLVTALGAWITHRFRRERAVRVAVIGSHEFARGLEAELNAIGLHGYRVVGCIDPGRACDRNVVAGVPCLGSLRLLRQAVLDNALELLVLGPIRPALGPADPGESEVEAEGPSRLEVFEIVADACLDLPVSLMEASELYERILGYVPLGTTNSAWYQHVLHPEHRRRATSKRLLDLGLGLIAGIIAAPIVALAAVAIKLSDGGPILYRQTRIGEGCREIELLKLRTVSRDADSHPEPGDQVTAVGRVLRRLHINELPQIRQVLKGEMSLVGPRPEIPELDSWLGYRLTYYHRRHLLKPGITGWAQIRCGYSGTPTGEAWKLCHDFYYLKRGSVLFDLLIILETIGTVFLPEPTSRPDESFIVAYRSAEEMPLGEVEQTAVRASTQQEVEQTAVRASTQQ
jgi:lipopolysaccharide/colanic/teichoic acid biosynthesis glycosyltransferase